MSISIIIISIIIIRDGNPGRPPTLSHSSWILLLLLLQFCSPQRLYGLSGTGAQGILLFHTATEFWPKQDLFFNVPLRPRHRDRTDYWRRYPRYVNDGSCHKYNFCRDKHVFVATKDACYKNYVCHDNFMFVATKLSSRQIFVATNIILSRQTYFCRDKRVLSWQTRVCRGKNDTCGSCRQWYR